MSEKQGISCPKCKRHIEIEYVADFNVARKNEPKESYLCEGAFFCPKCGTEITLYGTIRIQKAAILTNISFSKAAGV